MKIKNFLLIWLLTFIVVFPLNGIFHGGVAASFFDNNLQGLSCVKKMKDTSPLPVALLDLIITFGMTFLITGRQKEKIKLADGAIIGALVNLISSGAWNLANTAMFNWSLVVTIGDIAWHTSLGFVGGLWVAVLFNWRIKRESMR